MSKCWYCNNELTTGDNPKHFGICNKCYNEMFKSSDTIIRSFTNKISDLEAKLEEKDEQIKRRIAVYEKQFIEQTNENCELKQQLAEKDKEIEKLTEELDDKNFCKDFVDLYTENKLKTQMLHENWKDKISFAVEQLEKVEVCLKEGIEEVKSLLDPIEYEEYHELLGVGRGYKNSIEVIDNQINKLKEMK